MDVAVVARGNIQPISYILQTEQHTPFELMLFRLGNITGHIANREIDLCDHIPNRAVDSISI